jgi:hypothetical protein
MAATTLAYLYLGLVVQRELTVRIGLDILETRSFQSRAAV